MTSPRNKQIYHKCGVAAQAFGSKQAGVTLLLSILILSSVVAISFSIATILLIEIRNSGNLSRSEPAWYAAETNSEEYLFQIRRGISSSGFPFTAAVNNVSLISTTSPLANPIQEDRVLAASNTFDNTKNKYLLYDTSHPLYGGSNYSRVQITYLNTGSSGQIHIYVCQFDPSQNFDCNNPATDPGSAAFMIYSDSLPLNSGDSVYIDASSGFNPNLQQELIIFGSDASSDRFIQIQSWDAAGNLKGLPFFNTTVVNISGTQDNVTRSLQLKIPHN